MTAASQSIFERIAATVADAQAMLERMELRDGWKYTIPRTSLDLRFRLLVDERGVRLIFDRRRERFRTSHKLCFSLLAQSARPTAIHGQPLSVDLRMPPFLLPAEQERDMGRAAERFAGAPGPADGKDTGLVCFCLPSITPRYFVARVTPRHEDDIIRIFVPDAPVLETYPRLLYAPYRELFAALRTAQREGRFVPYAYLLGSDIGWGWDRFDEFIATLWESYCNATEVLAAAQPPGEMPAFFRVDDFQAELFYSPWTLKAPGPAGVDFFDAEDDWIHNRVVISHDSRQPAAAIELRAPEFLLSGDARRRLFSAMAAASGKMAEKCSKLRRVAEEEFERQPADALIFLSYEKEPPNKGFLLVWPGEDGDFLITFDCDGEKLKDPEAHAFVPFTADFAFKISSGAYQVIHNFFRAVRLWRTRKSKI